MSKKVIVAEGDSWFALSSAFWTFADVLSKLRKVKDGNGKRVYRIKNVASTSDKIRSMAYSPKQFRKFKRKLTGLDKPPYAILLSGGGNDLTKNSLEMMLNYNNPSNPIDDHVAYCVIDKCIRKAYNDLLEKINVACKRIFDTPTKIPVLIHGYAYSIPDGNDFGWEIIPGLPGPWLKPAFKNRGYQSLKTRTSIMRKLTDRFNSMVKSLDSDKNQYSNIYVRYVDLRSCLITDLTNKKYRKHWADELHPTPKGFKLIARKFHLALESAPTIAAT